MKKEWPEEEWKGGGGPARQSGNRAYKRIKHQTIMVRQHCCSQAPSSSSATPLRDPPAAPQILHQFFDAGFTFSVVSKSVCFFFCMRNLNLVSWKIL